MIHSKKVIGTVGIMSGLPSNLFEFTKSMINFVDFNNHWICQPNERILYLPSPHSFHALARDTLVRGSLGNWLLMLDTDHAFGPDLLARLLRAMSDTKAECVSALYLHKKPPYNPTIWAWTDDDFGHVKLSDWDKNEPFEFGAAGAGCLLTKMSVFDRIRDELGESPFSVSEYPGTVGEDFAFFRRLRRLGIKPVCDPRIQCHHLEVRPLDAYEDYDPEAMTGQEVALAGSKAAEAAGQK